MSRLAWLTKSALPNSVREFVITLPDDELWQADFFGAIVPLIESDNWEEHGDLSADEMADYWSSVLLPQLGGLNMAVPVGTIICKAGPTVPLDYLPCDGASLVRVEYQDLFDEIGVTYGSVDGDHFNLPNLLGRFMLGDTASHPAGETGGEEMHTLSIAEIPAHSHSPQSPSTGFLTVRTGGVYSLPAAGTAVGQPTVTANSGGGGGHNNMPPYLGVYMLIKVR